MPLIGSIHLLPRPRRGSRRILTTWQSDDFFKKFCRFARWPPALPDTRHLENAHSPRHRYGNHVAHPYGMRRLRHTLAVNPDTAIAHQTSRQRACFRNPRKPQPPVEPLTSYCFLAGRFTFRTLGHRKWFPTPDLA